MKSVNKKKSFADFPSLSIVFYVCLVLQRLVIDNQNGVDINLRGIVTIATGPPWKEGTACPFENLVYLRM